MKTLGIDLGGTKIAIAVIEDGKILELASEATPQDGYQSVLAGISKLATILLETEHDIEGIGLGVPGPVDYDSGNILFAANIRGLKDVSITADLKRELGFPVFIENDANAAGFAEHIYGAGKELGSSIYVTLSTGIGGGMFIGDEIVRGHHGSAGEIGHMILQPDGPICGFGHSGCWEALASGRAIARDLGHSNNEKTTTRIVFEKAKAGDRKALTVVNNAARFSGRALANLQKVFDPEGFVIGGGMLNAGSFYLDKIQKAADYYSMGFPNVKIFPAKLSTNAGVIGASAVASMALRKLSTN